MDISIQPSLESAAIPAIYFPGKVLLYQE